MGSWRGLAVCFSRSSTVQVAALQALQGGVDERVLAIILGGGAGTAPYRSPRWRAKQPCPGRPNTADRLFHQHASILVVNKIYGLLDQFNSASSTRHLTRPQPSQAGFGQGFVEVLAASRDAR